MIILRCVTMDSTRRLMRKTLLTEVSAVYLDYKKPQFNRRSAICCRGIRRRFRSAESRTALLVKNNTRTYNHFYN